MVPTWSPHDERTPLADAQRRVAVLCGRNVDELEARALVSRRYANVESVVVVLFPPTARTKLERVEDKNAERIVLEKTGTHIELFSLPEDVARRFTHIDYISKTPGLGDEYFCIYSHDPEEVIRPAVRA